MNTIRAASTLSAFAGTAVVMTGTSRETVKLAPAGDNVLKGSAGAEITAATKVLVSVTVGGKTEQARFMEKEKLDAHKGHKH